MRNKLFFIILLGSVIGIGGCSKKDEETGIISSGIEQTQPGVAQAATAPAALQTDAVNVVSSSSIPVTGGDVSSATPVLTAPESAVTGGVQAMPDPSQTQVGQASIQPQEMPPAAVGASPENTGAQNPSVALGASVEQPQPQPQTEAANNANSISNMESAAPSVVAAATASPSIEMKPTAEVKQAK